MRKDTKRYANCGVFPNSLHEECTSAWNIVSDMRTNAQNEKESERALKLMLWLPHGLLHEHTQGGKNGNKRFREMARRFSLWRQRDISGLMKGWKLEALKADRTLSKVEVKKERNDMGRIDRALRLIRKGAISWARKALESMGLGYLSDPVMLQEHKEKFT